MGEGEEIKLPPPPPKETKLPPPPPKKKSLNETNTENESLSNSPLVSDGGTSGLELTPSGFSKSAVNNYLNPPKENNITVAPIVPVDKNYHFTWNAPKDDIPVPMIAPVGTSSTGLPIQGTLPTQPKDGFLNQKEIDPEKQKQIDILDQITKNAFVLTGTDSADTENRKQILAHLEEQSKIPQEQRDAIIKKQQIQDEQNRALTEHSIQKQIDDVTTAPDKRIELMNQLGAMTDLDRLNPNNTLKGFSDDVIKNYGEDIVKYFADQRVSNPEKYKYNIEKIESGDFSDKEQMAVVGDMLRKQVGEHDHDISVMTARGYDKLYDHYDSYQQEQSYLNDLSKKVSEQLATIKDPHDPRLAEGQQYLQQIELEQQKVGGEMQTLMAGDNAKKIEAYKNTVGNYNSSVTKSQDLIKNFPELLKKQKIDEEYLKDLEENHPIQYQVTQAGAKAWNTVVDFGTSIAATGKLLYDQSMGRVTGDINHYDATDKLMEDIRGFSNNYLKATTSDKPIFEEKKDGTTQTNWNQIIPNLAEAGANMFLLLQGGGSANNTLMKLGNEASMAEKGGMFVSSFVSSADNYYKKAKLTNPNLTDAEAYSYATTAAGLSSMLFTYSPFAKDANALGKSQQDLLQKNISNAVDAIMEKQPSKVISGYLENVMGANGIAVAQKMSDNLVGFIANNTFNPSSQNKFNTSISPQELYETALTMTALTMLHKGGTDLMHGKDIYNNALYTIGKVDPLKMQQILLDKVKSGEMSQPEADGLLTMSKISNAAQTKMPDTLSEKEKITTLPLLIKKMQLEEKTKNADSSFKPVMDEKINEVEKEIQKEAGIKVEETKTPNKDESKNQKTEKTAPTEKNVNKENSVDVTKEEDVLKTAGEEKSPLTTAENDELDFLRLAKEQNVSTQEDEARLTELENKLPEPKVETPAPEQVPVTETIKPDTNAESTGIETQKGSEEKTPVQEENGSIRVRNDEKSGLGPVNTKADVLSDEEAPPVANDKEIVSKLDTDVEVMKKLPDDKLSIKQKAVEKRIDQAVKDGKLNQETADIYKKAVNDVSEAKKGAKEKRQRVKDAVTIGAEMFRQDLIDSKIISSPDEPTKKNAIVDVNRVIDLAVKIAHKSIDAGFDIKESVEKALASVKGSPLYKRMVENKTIDEKEFDKGFHSMFERANKQEEKETVREQEQKKQEENKKVGVTKEAMKPERVEAGLTESDKLYVKKERKDQWENVKKGIADGTIDTKETISKLLTGEKEPNSKDVLVLLHEKTKLKIEHDEVSDNINKLKESGDWTGAAALYAKKLQIEDQQKDILTAADLVGSKGGDLLQSMKSLSGDDFSYSTLKHKAEQEQGYPLSKEQEAKFQKLADDHQQLRKQLDDLQKQVDTQNEERKNTEDEIRKKVENDIIEKIKNEYELSKKKPVRKPSLSKEEAARKAELRKKFTGLNDITRMVTLLADKDFYEYSKLLFKEAYGDFKYFAKEMSTTLSSYFKKDAPEAVKAEIEKHLPMIFRSAGGTDEQIKTGEKSSENSTKEFNDLAQKVIDNADGEFHEGLRSGLMKMVRNRVEDNVNIKINEVVTEIHDKLKDHISDLTKQEVRDLISGYGKFKKLSRDETDTAIRELKRQGVLDAKIEATERNELPLRNGVEREQKTQETREKEKLISKNIKEKGLVPEPTEAELESSYKSSLAAHNRRLENAIEDVRKEISTGKRREKAVSKEYRDSMTDSLERELNGLKQIRDAQIPQENKTLTDAQKVNLSIKATEKVIAAIEKGIQNLQEGKTEVGDIYPEKKKPSKEIVNERLSELKNLRDGLKQERESLLPESMKDKVRYEKYKKSREKRLEFLENKLKTGDFAPKQKVSPPPLTKETEELNGKIRKKEGEVMTEMEKIKRKNMTTFQKVIVGAGRLHRFNIFLNPAGQLKVTLAAVLKTISKVPSEIAHGILSVTPGLKNIVEKDPSQFGMDLQSLSKYYSTLLSKETFKESMREFKGGSHWSHLHTKDVEHDNSWLEKPQQMHGAAKTFPKIAEYEASYLKALNNLAKNGEDITDPNVRQKAKELAEMNALAAVFMNKNEVARLMQGFVTGAIHSESSLVKGLGFALNQQLPVIKVPQNFYAEVLRSTPVFGTLAVALEAHGIIKNSGEKNAAPENKGGIKNLTPEQANKAARYLTQQTVGLMVTGLGFALYSMWGDDLKKKLEHLAYYLHNPAALMMMNGMNMAASEDNKGIALLKESGKELLKETKALPEVRTGEDISKILMNGKSLSKKGQEMLGSLLIPAGLDALAKKLDNDRKRDPETFKEVMMSHIPGLRQMVPYHWLGTASDDVYDLVISSGINPGSPGKEKTYYDKQEKDKKRIGDNPELYQEYMEKSNEEISKYLTSHYNELKKLPHYDAEKLSAEELKKLPPSELKKNIEQIVAKIRDNVFAKVTQ